jgi:hypothetical protein
MIDIPPDIVLKSSIRPGSIYYFRHDAFSSEYPHYFVVININPISEKILFLVCATSERAKIKERRRNCPPETLVLIKPHQYPTFPFPSIFDCNNVIETSIDRLIQKLTEKKLSIMPELGSTFVDLLRAGVLVSPLVTGRVKDQLR